jgi:glycosyltransferase involved in cell wall biosynthesis
MKSLLEILIVDHVSTLGGAEFSLEGLVRSMPQEKYRYTVALPSPGPLEERLREKDIPVDIIPVESWRWWTRTIDQQLKFWLLFPLQLVSLGRWVKYLWKKKPGIIHININRLVEPVIAAHIVGIPVVMHFRDIPSQMSYRFVLGKKGFYWLMNLANYWIANSHATGHDIRPFCKRSVEVIPNAIDLIHFDTNSHNGKTVHQDFPHKVAMIAGLVPWKNHYEYIELAKKVLVIRDDVEFLIVGTGQKEYTSYLKKLAEDLELSGRLKFMGFIENVPSLLKNIAILIHTTTLESFGRVFIEAMAARRPVVAFNSGGASEIVVDGETGLLVPPGDLDAMAAAVSQLLDDPISCRRMGESGRKRVEEYYLLDKHCQAVTKLYDKLLASEY